MHESTRGYMFDIGDTVKVISPKLKTHFKTGIVIDRFIDKSNCRKSWIEICKRINTIIENSDTGEYAA